jgi:NAD(P)-dependent dehydrogenase (short-subunit alcohol dehydrogenase family)
VVVANAGVANNGTVAANPVSALVRTIEVDLVGVVRTVSATLPHVTRGRGYYLLVSSAAAFTVLPGMACYCAAKAGVEQFGNALRLELAHKGVAVGTAHPGWVDTDLVRDMRDDLPALRRTLPCLEPTVFTRPGYWSRSPPPTSRAASATLAGCCWSRPAPGSSRVPRSSPADRRLACPAVPPGLRPPGAGDQL